MTRLLFLQHDSVFENYGGIQYYLDDLVQLAHDHYGTNQVRTLILSRKQHETPPKPSYDVQWVPIQKKGILGKIQNRFPVPLVNAAFKQIAEFQPTWIIASHISLAPVAYFLSRKTHVPFGVIAYGMECWGNLWPQDEWSLKRADRIFSISHWTKKVLIERGYKENRIRIIHPLLPAFYKDGYQPAQESETFKLITVARLDPTERYKGQDDTLWALAQLRKKNPHLDFCYQIVGEGGDLERLKRIVHDLHLENFVKFIRPVKDRSELIRLYQQSDLFVMPSRYGKWDGKWKGEGFGIVYVEAAACGLPTLAYDCGGVTDIVEKNETGLLVTANKREELVDALHQFMTDSSKRKAMGQKASQLVRERFGVSAVEKEMADAFTN